MQNSTVQSGSVPGRKWYAAAVLVFVVGMAVFVVFVAGKVLKVGDDFVRVTVPGQAELTLDPGTYTIFHEQGGTTDGADGAVIGNVTGLRVRVQRPGDGAAVRLTPDAAARYSVEGPMVPTSRQRSGQSLFTFTITEPGTYRLVAAYDDGRAGPQAVLAIARGFMADLLTTVLASLAIWFGSAGIAMSIAIYVYRRRRRALAPPSPP